MALLIAVIVLLLMSALGLSALQHAGDEASGSGRSRRKDATLYAAESGLKMVAARMAKQSNPEIPVVLNEQSLITDAFGNAITVVSGAPDKGELPVPVGIQADPNYPGELPEGEKLNTGTSSPIFHPVRADVTAMDSSRGMVHLQAQYKVYEGSGGP
jgi:hypothetical protein